MLILDTITIIVIIMNIRLQIRLAKIELYNTDFL